MDQGDNGKVERLLRSRRRLVPERKFAGALLVLSLLAGLLTPTALGAQNERSAAFAKLDGLFEEQKKGGMKVAATGDGLEGAASILVELLPSADERSKAVVGQRDHEVIVAAAPVVDGRVELRLNPSQFKKAGDIWVHLLNDEGDVVGGIAATVGKPGKGGFAPLDLTAGDINPIPAEESGPFLLSEDDEEFVTCWWTNEQTGIEASTALIRAGTNTKHIEVSAEFNKSSSAKLGVSLKISGSSPWGAGGGTVSVNNSATTTWGHQENNRYGTWDFEKVAKYNRQERVCTNALSGTGQKRLVPTGFIGQFGRYELKNRKYPKQCVSTTIGSLAIEDGTASTISKGVNLPSFYGVSADVNSQSGFSENTKVTFNVKSTGKFLCGTNNRPEENYPGVIMGDFKRR